MPKNKEVWTVNKTCCDFFSSDVKFRSETVFESLFDALHQIGVWYNMKTMQGYKVKIENEEIRNDETTFVARHEEKQEVEQVTLQCVAFRPKKEP